ncbi:hypothetical protein RFI_24491, partial [Reticulomyxa filosa]
MESEWERKLQQEMKIWHRQILRKTKTKYRFIRLEYDKLVSRETMFDPLQSQFHSQQQPQSQSQSQSQPQGQVQIQGQWTFSNKKKKKRNAGLKLFDVKRHVKPLWNNALDVRTCVLKYNQLWAHKCNANAGVTAERDLLAWKPRKRKLDEFLMQVFDDSCTVEEDKDL